MQARVKHDTRFIFIGTSPDEDDLVLAIPYPAKGSAFSTARLLDSVRNANGVVVGQVVGKSGDTQNMSWNAMDPEQWYEMNNWIEKNGMFFWCRYFSFTSGQWQTREFYCSDVSCEPHGIDPQTGKPALILNASLNVMATGRRDTK